MTTPTPCPSGPDDSEGRTHGLAAFAHTDEKSQQAMVSRDTPTPGCGSGPQGSDAALRRCDTDIPPTSKTSDDGDGSPAPDAPEAALDGAEGDPEDIRGSREAARYRRQLRAVEADRDALAGQLLALQRQQVEARATVLGIRPAALWAAGVSVADLLGEDGGIDSGKVADAVASVKETFGIKPKATPRPRMFRSGASSSAVPTSGPSWSSAFAPKEN